MPPTITGTPRGHGARRSRTQAVTPCNTGGSTPDLANTAIPRKQSPAIEPDLRDPKQVVRPNPGPHDRVQMQVSREIERPICRTPDLANTAIPRKRSPAIEPDLRDPKQVVRPNPGPGDRVQMQVSLEIERPICRTAQGRSAFSLKHATGPIKRCFKACVRIPRSPRTASPPVRSRTSGGSPASMKTRTGCTRTPTGFNAYVRLAHPRTTTPGPARSRSARGASAT